MKRIWIVAVFCLPLPGLAQESEKYDPRALRASEELTREANEELADNEFVDAEANFRRAISKSVENTVAPYNLGNAYYSKESYGEAFGRYKEAGERAGKKPNKHKAFHNTGNVYMKQKDYQKAVEAYKEALRNDPTDEETRYNLALAKELLKKDQEQQQNNEDNEEEKEQDQQNQDQQNQDQNEGDSQENQEEQDNQQDGDSEKEENKEGDGDKKQEQDRKPEEKDQPQQPRPNQLSPQQIQNLLQAMENEEKKVKEKLDAQRVKGAQVKTEKDW